MLKSIDFMNRLEDDLNKNIRLEIISNFFIELRINNHVDVYIVSDKVNSFNELDFQSIKNNELNNINLMFKFISTDESESDDYKYFLKGNRVSYGLRRSLGALLDNKKPNHKVKENVLTFFSYKGGVGRTTSLALTATHLARKGKNVFVIDCDFEAPGLINFFNISQLENSKSGLVEYLNDKMFVNECNMEDYVLNIERNYSGIGAINLMPSGNILSHNPDDLVSYLEGLAKIDLQGVSLIKTFQNLIDEINSKYSPDVILIDSRTGFNNVFGALVNVSKHVVVLAGDDIQNLPGIEYVSMMLRDMEVNASFILSVLSSNFTRRYNNFEKQIQNLFQNNTDTFYFDRQNTLEFIGTSLADLDDLNDFISGENGSAQYQRFFKHIEQIIIEDLTAKENSNDIKNTRFDLEKPAPGIIEEESTSFGDDVSNSDALQNRIILEIKSKLPDLYAENIEYNELYIKNHFYFRPCMEDLFIPEKAILLGDKGTGKTAFYQALKNNKFFELLKSKSQKSQMSYKVFNVTDFENDNFEILYFQNHLEDEFLIKRFWIYFIWNSFSGKVDSSGFLDKFKVDLKKDSNAEKLILRIIENDEDFEKIDQDLLRINNDFKYEDKKIILTFDKLDNIVKPVLWNDFISPLIKLCVKCPWDYIFPKLFLRRDLYERLGNLTNKNSLSTRCINLEWSQNEMFSYFLKIVFAHCKNDFFEYLDKYSKVDTSAISKKLKSKGDVHNQLPLDTYLIKPIINEFFGEPKVKRNGKKSTAYDDLYRNIQSADKTVNLRPFLDLIANGIIAQEEQDHEKNFRKDSILGLAYCTSSQVRKNAVIKYLEDLWGEKGNEFVRFFCQDLSNNRVPSKYKKNILYEDRFEQLLELVKKNHEQEMKELNGSIEHLKQVLIANKIITSYMVGSQTRYAFAYLYTNYLGI